MSLWLEHKLVVYVRDMQNHNHPIEDRRERPVNLSRWTLRKEAAMFKAAWNRLMMPQILQHATVHAPNRGRWSHRREATLFKAAWERLMQANIARALTDRHYDNAVRTEAGAEYELVE